MNENINQNNHGLSQNGMENDNKQNIKAEIFISYSWGGESEIITDEIDKSFFNNGITIIRDKRDAGFKADIDDFMHKIGSGKYIIIVVSNNYLMKRNCMYELLKIFENKNFNDRIFPVVLPDTKIYSAIDRLEYIGFWNNKLKELNEKVAMFAMQGITIGEEITSIISEINLFKKITFQIDKLADIFRKMNTLSIDTLRKSNYQELINSIIQQIKIDNSSSSFTIDNKIIKNNFNGIKAYAIFLHTEKKDYEQAEIYYQKALEVNSKDSELLASYAVFLDESQNNYKQAEEYYKLAIDCNPKDATAVSNYAIFLHNNIKDYKNAEIYYQKALEINSNDSDLLTSYAVFLDESQRNYKQAEEYYKLAIECNPKSATALGNYAIFLHNNIEDYKNAEKYYKLALKYNYDDSNFYIHYASFLSSIKNDIENAEKFYLKAKNK